MGNACCCNDSKRRQHRRRLLERRRPSPAPPPTRRRDVDDDWPGGAVKLFRQGVAGHPCVEERYDLGRDRMGHRLGLGVVRRVFNWNTADDGAAAYWCKTIPLSGLEPPTLVENVRAEVATIAALPRHPTLPRLREVYEDDTAVHLVMDCDDGEAAAGDARTLLSDSKVMPDGEAARVARAVVDVVRVLHQAGIIHRDLKPANFILFSGHLQVKLLDFCCATRFSGPGENETCLFTGTMGPNSYDPSYMAPEVLYGGRYGPRADVWSAGVIIHQLLYGRHPFPPLGVGESSGKGQRQASPRDDMAELLPRRQPWSPPLIHVSNDGGAEDLIRTMLEPNPRKRPSALQALEHPWLKGQAPATATLN